MSVGELEHLSKHLTLLEVLCDSAANLFPAGKGHKGVVDRLN